MKVLVLTGLACPEPVLRVKAALEEAPAEGLLAVVDNTASRENVSRYAGNLGYAVNSAQNADGHWEITIAPGCALQPESYSREASASLGTVFLMLSDRLGKHSELGRVLMKVFLATLTKATRPPAKMLFLNEAVNLTTEGSDSLEDLKQLAERGVEIVSCGTCLDFFGKKDRLSVGAVGNMFDTVETLTQGFEVVTIT